MKKILAIVLCLTIALTSAIAMSISTFADATPIIFNYTVDNDANTFYPEGNFVYEWGASVAGTSAYDTSEKAWVLTTTIELPPWATAYDSIWKGSYTAIVDWSTYKYMAICYKTTGANDALLFAILNDDAAQVFELPAQSNYDKQVFSTEGFTDADGEVGHHIIPTIVNVSSNSAPIGLKLAIKYIAFFETEAEAKDYEFIDSGSGKIGDTAIIFGAVILCAAVAAVVVFGRKRSK